MNVAQRLNPYLLQAIDKDTSLDMIFFDGKTTFIMNCRGRSLCKMVC